MKKHSEKLYQKYEALSPIYQGGLTNHLPMMFTVLMECDVEDHVIVALLDHYKTEKDLYELTDITYPTSEFEQAYINQTSYYLGKIHEKGIDVVVGMFLNDMTKALSSALYHGLIRLAYALRSKNDMLIAQGLAYFELVKNDVEIKGQPIEVHQLKSSMEELFEFRKKIEVIYPSNGSMEKFDVIKQQLKTQHKCIRLEHIELHQKMILKEFLRHYHKTQDFYTLHVITGFHALLMIQEYFGSFQDALQQFFYSAQIMMLLDADEQKIVVEDTKTFTEMMQDITRITDAHDLKLFFSLYELYNQFDVRECLDIASSIVGKYQ